MNIAFYAPLKPPDHPVPSGDRRMARALMTALARSGHRVVLASRLRSRDGDGDPARQTRLGAIGRRLAARLVRRAAATDRFDLWFTYHVYYKAPDHLGPAVAAALGIPYVIAEASHAPRRADGPWAVGHAAAAAAIRRAEALFVVNSADRPGLRALGCDEGRLIGLPPFLDPAPFAAAAAARPAHRAALAAAHRLDPRAVRLIAVGMMRAGAKERSFAVLADALRCLPDRRWQLILVGDGPRRAAIEAAFAGLPAERLVWLGAVDGDRLPALYAAADLMVWPAIDEAYGMALLEAQATGLAVVAGHSGGVGDIVAAGTTGELVPPGDAAAFAGALGALIDDPARRAAYAAAAEARVAAEHDLARAAARLDRVLSRLTGANPVAVAPDR